LKARFKHLASLLGILLFGALLILVVFTEFNVIFPLERIIKQIGIVRRNSSPESAQEYLGANGDVNNAIQELIGILNLLEANRAAAVDSEKYARTLIEAMPDAFLVVNNNGIILIAKSESEDEFGSRAEMLIGRDLSALNLENSETQRLSERLVRVLNTGRLHVLEFRRKKEDGSYFWGEARISKLDSNRALVFVRDVTALRQGEEERDRFDDQILQVQKFESLGVLASGIAHDFNNIFQRLSDTRKLLSRSCRKASHCNRNWIILYVRQCVRPLLPGN
jgi:PAS domain S-box-containing protein